MAISSKQRVDENRDFMKMSNYGELREVRLRSKEELDNLKLKQEFDNSTTQIVKFQFQSWVQQQARLLIVDFFVRDFVAVELFICCMCRNNLTSSLFPALSVIRKRKLKNSLHLVDDLIAVELEIAIFVDQLELREQIRKYFFVGIVVVA